MILVKPSVSIMAASGHPELPYSYDRVNELIEAAGRTCYKSEDNAWTVCPECGGNSPNDKDDPIGECRRCGTCYGEYKTSADKFVDMLRRRGHLAMLEHSWIIREAPNGYAQRSAQLKHLIVCPFWGGFSLFAGNLRAFEEAGFMKHGTAQLFVPPKKSVPNESKAMTARIVCDRGVSHEIVRHRPASYAQKSTRYCDESGGVAFVIPPWVEDIEPGNYPWSLINDEIPGQPETSARRWAWACLEAERNYIDLRKDGWRPEQARSVLPNSLKTEIVVTASLAEWQHIFSLRCAPAAHPQMREVMIPLRNEAAKLFPEVF